LLALALLFNRMGVAWLRSYAAMASRGRNVLAHPRLQRILDRLSGVVLIGLGARLAVERR
jgi:threonine/homoserine/homoserine lactone efflux protein